MVKKKKKKASTADPNDNTLPVVMHDGGSIMLCGVAFRDRDSWSEFIYQQNGMQHTTVSYHGLV